MPRRYHHGDLRNALLDAAVVVAAEQGVAAITVSGLARACGVSSGAPFRHFASRLDLLVAAAERAVQGQVRAMSAAAASVSDPLDIERAMGVAYVRWVVEHPGEFAILDAAEVAGASEMIRAANAAFQQRMDVVLGGERIGEVAPELLRRTAGALAGQALAYGLARMVVGGVLGDLSPDQVERLAWEVTGVLGTGLR